MAPAAQIVTTQRVAQHLVKGDTDSERFFALVTKETAERDGDVTAGLVAAARWVAQELPLFALNVVLITNDNLWALRYPDTHSLYVLERAPGRPLEHSSSTGTVRVQSADLNDTPAVVVASEPMDEDEAWRPLPPASSYMSITTCTCLQRSRLSTRQPIR